MQLRLPVVGRLVACKSLLPSRTTTTTTSSSSSRTRLQHAAAAAAGGVAATAPQDSQRSDEPLEAALYVVATPIGNLEDITFRALRILRSVNLILAEDTRHTRKLLEHFGIRTATSSFHQHNEKQREEGVLARLQQGEPIALVSDAGMPAISDPGALLVAKAVAAGVRVVPVPGPCAAVAALAASGLPTDRFLFVGFLPPKSGKRQAALQQVQHVPATLVFYAPPHGLAAILSDMIAVLGPERRAVVARELTKLHEEFYRGSLAACLDEFGPDGRRQGVVRGELVLLVEGCSEANQLLAAATAAAAAAGAAQDAAAATGGELQPAAAAGGDDVLLRQVLLQELQAGSTVSASAKRLSKQLQVPRSRLYKLALALEAELQQQPGPQQRTQQQHQPQQQQQQDEPG